MRARFRLTSASLLFPLLATVGMAAGCGDNVPSQADAGAGGSVGTGGHAGAGGAAGTGGGTAIDGGAGTGGSAGTGGVAGTGGGAGTGGVAGTGGGAGTGVAGNGGHAGTGGVTGTGGTAGTGVAGNGGHAGTGVAGTNGAGGTGVAGTGGHAGTGVAGTNGSGGTGVAGAGGTGGTTVACYTTAFTAPLTGSTLTVANDTDHTCADGFQYTVTITSSAPTGTAVELFDGSSLLLTSTVSAGGASFAVQLPSSGTTQLSIQYPSTAACSVQSNVTVNCPNSPPTCAIAAPTISASHPDLNGVAAPAGDRTSSTGSAYQATFVVNTNAEDGQPVTLAVDNIAAPTVITTLSATALNGSAAFGVPLTPDGTTYEVVASCTNKNGVTGTSTKSSYPVDFTPPDLTVNSPISGQFFGPGSLDVNGAFQVCAQTDSSDAAGLSSALGAAQQNLCVGLGSATTCTAVAAVNSSTCVSVVCPGSAPFSLGITLKDAAGNPTTQTVTGITCSSTLPSVQVISPLSDSGTFSDKSKHILAATAPVGVHDLDPTTPGAQANVVACSDTAGSAALLVGHAGGTLTQLGASVTDVAAVASDNCPAGLGFVARFSGDTLPESNESGLGALVAASELKVSLTSTANTAAVGTSAAVDVWIDSIPPSLTLTAPPALCGSFTQSAATVNQDVLFTADDAQLTVDVTNGASTTTYDTPSFVGGVATFSNVAFTQGQNNLTASETDPAGNETDLTPVPCAVTVGTAPVVTFTTPTAGAILCPPGATGSGCIDDTDPTTPGWQGNLAVTVLASTVPVVGSTVTFTLAGATLGSAVTDATGSAQINGVTLPDGIETILATTDNVPGAGVGSGTVNVTVDSTPPNAPTGIAASIVDRRKTSMQLIWTAPSDSIGNAVVGYQVRYAKVPITSANFNDSTVTTAVTFAGAPGAPGQVDGLTVSGLYIENGYYFAVEAINSVGTTGPLDATGTAVAAHFNDAILVSPTGTNDVFGATADGSGDLNGDGIPDLVVGTSNASRAYLYLGSTTFAAGAPSVTFSSATDTFFGTGVGQIGDIDGDHLQDIAIADSSISVIYIYKGRTNWPATLTDLQADYVISTSGSWSSASAGASFARLGDFDGDGIDDFAIGGPTYGGTNRSGRVAVVYGSTTFSNFTLPNAARELDIGGDPALTKPQFGLRVVGLGHVYSVTTGTTMIVSAPGLGNATNTSDNQGRLYAFHGRPTGAAIDATSADSVIVGPGKGALIGQTLANLGPVLNGFNSLGSGNSADTLSVPGATGSAFVFSGTPAAGPLASTKIVYQATQSPAGQMVFGGGVSGRDGFISLIGSSTLPDVAIVAGTGFVDIIDGAIFAGLASPVEADQGAQVHVPLPTGWSFTGSNSGGLIPDINNDGYADFVLGDHAGTIPGRVVVFW